MKAHASRFALRPWAPAVLLWLSVLSVPAHADDSKQACAKAYEQTQSLRKASKLREAKEQVKLCAVESCPAFVKKDCVVWLDEIENSIPTVTFQVKRDGEELVNLQVWMGKIQLKEKLDGKSVGVDPGEQTFRFTNSKGESTSKTVVVRQGEKNRIILINWPSSKPAASGTGTPPPPDPPPKREQLPTETSGGPPLGTWVLGGVGLVGLGAFATFGLLGKGQRSDLEKSCSPNCSASEVDKVKSKYLIADISLGVGVVSLGIAAVLWLTASPNKGSERPQSAWLVDWVATPQGGMATVGQRF
jgi:hypothetical protein